jgi:hypothetical protein
MSGPLALRSLTDCVVGPEWRMRVGPLNSDLFWLCTPHVQAGRLGINVAACASVSRPCPLFRVLTKRALICWTMIIDREAESIVFIYGV